MLTAYIVGRLYETTYYLDALVPLVKSAILQWLPFLVKFGSLIFSGQAKATNGGACQ
jgi:hypothetical protein